MPQPEEERKAKRFQHQHSRTEPGSSFCWGLVLQGSSVSPFSSRSSTRSDTDKQTEIDDGCAARAPHSPVCARIPSAPPVPRTNPLPSRRLAPPTRRRAPLACTSSPFFIFALVRAGARTCPFTSTRVERQVSRSIKGGAARRHGGCGAARMGRRSCARLGRRGDGVRGERELDHGKARPPLMPPPIRRRRFRRQMLLPLMFVGVCIHIYCCTSFKTRTCYLRAPMQWRLYNTEFV